MTNSIFRTLYSGTNLAPATTQVAVGQHLGKGCTISFKTRTLLNISYIFKEIRSKENFTDNQSRNILRLFYL